MDITFLHISDPHFGTADYHQDEVTKAFIPSIQKFVANGRKPDLIFVTGDIADKGKSAGYTAATVFFDELLTATNLQRSDIYIVPGNHDIDRCVGADLKRTLDNKDDSDRYFAPGRVLPHITNKMKLYIEWYN